MGLDFTVVPEHLDVILLGCLWTIFIAVAAALVSFFGGIIFAVIALYAPWIIRQPFRLIEWVFMGTPLLLQLFLIYFGLVQIGIDLPAFVAGIIGLGFAIVAALQNRAGYEHAVLAGLATMSLEPPLAVGLIFLISHALPVQLRQIDAYGPKRVLNAVGLASLFALAGTFLLGVATWYGILPPPVSVALAFGFATPHILSEDMR